MHVFYRYTICICQCPVELLLLLTGSFPTFTVCWKLWGQNFRGSPCTSGPCTCVKMALPPRCLLPFPVFGCLSLLRVSLLRVLLDGLPAHHALPIGAVPGSVIGLQPAARSTERRRERMKPPAQYPSFLLSQDLHYAPFPRPQTCICWTPHTPQMERGTPRGRQYTGSP